MKHFASRRFWQHFHALPQSTQHLARQCYVLLRQDPNHPSLHYKSVRATQYRSVRIGLHYRALGVPVPGGVQ